MRVLFLTDDAFSSREQAMITRLEVGLVADGVRVVRAIPEGMLAPEAGSVYARVVPYDKGFLGLRRATRARVLIGRVQEALERSSGGESSLIKAPEVLVGEAALIDVVHCFGESSWHLGIELGLQTGAGVVLEVHRGDLVSRAAELATRHGWGGELPAVVLFAPDRAVFKLLEEAMARIGVAAGGRSSGGRLILAPWGVHAPSSLPSTRRAAIEPAEALSIAVLTPTDGADAASLAVVDSLQEIARRAPGMLAFMDSDAAGHSSMWRRAQQHGLLPRISMVGSIEGYREPILHVDMLLQPGAHGEHRTLTLDAMAAGVLVVAAADPLVEALIDQTTARCVAPSQTNSAEAWTGAVLGLLAEPERALRQRETALAWVREHRSGAGHVASVLKGYELITGPGRRD